MKLYRLIPEKLIPAINREINDIVYDEYGNLYKISITSNNDVLPKLAFRSVLVETETIYSLTDRQYNLFYKLSINTLKEITDDSTN